MATIGSLIIEIAGDNSRLRRAFDSSRQLTEQYKREINSARREFGASSVRLREDLFAGVLSPAQFARQGTLAAREYNAAILKQIGELRTAGQLTPRLHATLVAELQDAGRKSATAFVESLESGLSRAGGALRGVGARLTIGATLPVAAEAIASFKAASDAAEELNAFAVTFGPTAGGVQRRLDELHRTIPVTTTQLRQLASGFGALLLPMGFVPEKAAVMSTRLVELAGDIQSLRNIPFTEVVQRLTSGLVGETEAVRRLGANIGETALKSEAMRLGFGNNVAALTGMQKATAIYNILLRDTQLATGDAANTVNSAANQVRFMRRNFDELQVAIGTQLLPVLTPLVARFAGMLERLKQVNPETVLFYAKLAGVIAIAGPLTTALGGVVGVLGALVRWSRLAYVAIAGAGGLSGAAAALPLALTGPAGWIVGIGLAVVALITWIDRMHSAKHAADELRDSVSQLSRAELASEISRRAAAIGALQRQAQTAPLVAADVTATGGAARRTLPELRSEIAAQSAQLSILTARWNELTRGETESAQIAARQLAIWREMAAASQALANAPTPTTPAAGAQALERTLSQVLQTQTALKAAGESSTFLNDRLSDIARQALNAELAHNLALLRQGKLYDDISTKLVEIRARAEAARGPLAATLPGLAVTPAAPVIPFQQFATPAEALARRQAAIAAGTLPTPVVAPPPAAAQILQAPPSVAELRFRVAIAVATESLQSFGRSLLDTVRGGALAALRSIAGQLNPFAQVISAIATAAEPLAPSMAQLAAVVARDLRPVFAAMVPVIDALIPVVDAVLRVLAPILTAVAPMLEAFVPVLRALFPIIKQGAIIATYLFQAFALGASIFLRAVGNIVVGFGVILKALATAIDKLPFVSAKGAISAAQDVIDFGRSLLVASDEFKQAASDMAKARGEIKDVEFDDAAASVKKLGEAAAETSDALRNVPTWWKSTLAIWEATHPRGGAPGSGGLATPGGGTDLNPSIPLGAPALVIPPIGAGGGGAAGGGGVTLLSLTIENVTVTEQQKSGRALLREIVREAQRISQATFGTTSRWADALE